MSLLKTPTPQRLVVIAALIAAIRSAYGSGDVLAFMGIAFYLVCIAALLIDHPRTGWLLLTAVAVHLGLTSYAIWRWQVMEIIPCHFCLLAAGFALLAAVIYYRPRMALLPLVLMVAVWWAWPHLFLDVEAEASSPAPTIETTESLPPAGPPDEVKPVDTGPDSTPVEKTENQVKKSQVVKKAAQVIDQQQPAEVETPTSKPGPEVQPTDKPPAAQPTAPAAEKPVKPANKPSSSG